MKTLETPASLSREPSKSEFHLPAYDWNKQSRNITKNAGSRFTVGSQQTFNSSGQPCDSKNDSNDE